MHVATTPQPGPLEAVAAIAPVVREYADESERVHQLADPVVAGMKRLGLFRCLTPKSLGGYEAEPSAWFRTVEAAARIDGSFGWILFINGGAGLAGKSMPEGEAEELFGDADTIVAGSVYPFGKAVATTGGYTVSGRWSYASGIAHATHVFGFAAVHDGDELRMVIPGVPAVTPMLTPVANIQRLTTWDVSGLCATGSHDFVMDQVFVPEKHALQLRSGTPNRHYAGPSYRLPFMTTFGHPMAAVALGIAQHSIDELLTLAAAKTPAGPAGSTLRERATFQVQLAEAMALVESARAWLHERLDAQYVVAQSGGDADLQLRNMMHLAASNATRSACRAVELMYLAGGGTSNYRKSALQRCMRDIHAVTQHAGTAPGTWEAAGAVAAGLPPRNPLMLL